MKKLLFQSLSVRLKRKEEQNNGKEKSSTLLNTVVLVVISVVAVALLAIVNQITLEPIAQADVNQKAEIYKVVYPGCDSFTEFDNAEE